MMIKSINIYFCSVHSLSQGDLGIQQLYSSMC